ncbi:MAG: ABC transporter permease subunit, partial [Agrobacterium tumefaciens]
MDIEFLKTSMPFLLKGLSTTATITAISVAIGFNLGLGLALMRLSENRFLAGFAKYYSMVFRGTPLLVQLFLFYYGLGQIGFIKGNAITWWVIS